MNRDYVSLYIALAEPAPEGEAGQTVETRAKETVDNDAETLFLATVGLAEHL